MSSLNIICSKFPGYSSTNTIETKPKEKFSTTNNNGHRNINSCTTLPHVNNNPPKKKKKKLTNTRLIERDKANKTINNYTNNINNDIENARKHKSFKTFNNYFYDYQFKDKLKINETINIQSNKEMIIISSTLDDENGKHKKNDNYELSNYELNNLKHEDFIKSDKRGFIQIYRLY